MSAEYAAAQQAKREALAVKTTIPGMPAQNDATKKKKKKNKNKGTNAITDELSKTTISEPAITNKSKNSVNAAKPQPPTSSRQDTSGSQHLTDSMKRLKNLRKKLREIEILEQKIKDGVIKNPEQEMRDKVSRKKEIQEEIRLLESNQW